MPIHQNQDLATGRGPSKINLWPWLLALTIVFLLIIRIPRESLYLACKKGPWLALGIYTLLQALLVLVLDVHAIRVALDIFDLKQSFSWLFLVRGATYILGILNYALGQGALGLYLQRLGITGMRATGIVLFLFTVTFLVLLPVAGFVSVMAGFWGNGHMGLPWLISGLMAGVLAYLVILFSRPRFLQKYQIVKPLMEAGLKGHLRAVLGRMPHIFIMIITFWGAMKLWGIPVPFLPGIAIVTVVLFVGSLPITPYGLGTSQTVLIFLCSPYVPSQDSEIRATMVLAFSLIYYSYGILFQALLGIWCWQKMRLDYLKDDGEFLQKNSGFQQ